MKDNQENVILVDKADNELGLMEKMQAHEQGVLHRAFSVFIFNSKGEMLLQQRAFGKYHSPGLWTNTCCSHPRHGESNSDAASRRLSEEMGMQCDIQELFHFIYKADVGQGLTEHELDHVFIGTSDMTPDINPEEVADFRYVDMQTLRDDIVKKPGDYTVWFKIAFEEVDNYFKNKILKQ